MSKYTVTAPINDTHAHSHFEQHFRYRQRDAYSVNTKQQSTYMRLLFWWLLSSGMWRRFVWWEGKELHVTFPNTVKFRVTAVTTLHFTGFLQCIQLNKVCNFFRYNQPDKFNRGSQNQKDQRAYGRFSWHDKHDLVDKPEVNGTVWRYTRWCSNRS